jgi:ATP-dependent Clp protease, protease subunit|tara:strand:- start:1317 stop:1925 length:609 start_codon:yes stop_codon:yes gene_type:complete
MSIYEEQTPKEPLVIEPPQASLYEALNNQLGTLLDYEDSVIFINDEINDHTLTDFIIRMRSLLQHRTDKNAPINLMINSPGGDIYEMFGIIDYIESLDVKVNTICRGRAFSAAAIILTMGTGNRMMSKRSTVMFHQSSSFLGGKMSDITAFLDNVKSLEKTIYDMLASRTKQDAEWWKNKMRSDMFFTADELLEIGVIDQVI